MRLTRDGVDSSSVGRVLSENDSKAGVEMEVDMAVEEPWTRVVSLCVDVIQLNGTLAST